MILYKAVLRWGTKFAAHILNMRLKTGIVFWRISRILETEKKLTDFRDKWNHFHDLGDDRDKDVGFIIFDTIRRAFRRECAPSYECKQWGCNGRRE